MTDLRFSGAIIVRMHFAEFNELLPLYHGFKLITTDKEVVLSMLLPGTRLASCVTHTKPKFINILSFYSLY